MCAVVENIATTAGANRILRSSVLNPHARSTSVVEQLILCVVVDRSPAQELVLEAQRAMERTASMRPTFLRRHRTAH